MTAQRIARMVCIPVLLGGFAADAGQAAVIAVDGTTCNLANAILSANGDAAVGGCTAGTGADTLVLGADVVLTAPVTASVEGGPSGLPAISSEIAITAGAGSVVERSSALGCVAADPTAFRILEVAAGGDLSLVGLTLRNGCIAADGTDWVGSGGAVLVLGDGSLRVDGCTLTSNTVRGGPAVPLFTEGPARGGAIAVLGGTLEIVDSTFSDNETLGFDSRGGAIAVEAGVVSQIAWSRLESNRASPYPLDSNYLAHPTSGGAISLREARVGSLAHLVVSANLAGTETLFRGGPATGGGIAITGGRIREVRDVLFSANVARAHGQSILFGTPGLGGGMANGGVIDSIVRTTFAGNQAHGYATGMGRGGGLDNTGNISRIVSSTFAGNVAEGHVGHLVSAGSSLGGGVANSGAIGRIAASTFVGNNCPRASGFPPLVAGGGLYDSATDESGTVVPTAGVALVDSLIAGNEATDPAITGGDCFSSGALTSLGFNLAQTPDASCILASSGDVAGVDPQAEPLADNGCAIALPGGGCLPTVALPATSPAIDAGLCGESGTEIDARGAVRPFDVVAVPNAPGGDGCDIGAFEREGALATVHIGLNVADSIDPVASGTGVGNLVYTVALSSLGSAAANSIAVAVTLPLPTGVSLDSVTPSVGSWNGATWSVPTLPSGASATLTFVLTVGFGTSGSPDALSLSAVVTAATGHNGEFATDLETTSVIEGVFFDGFESGDDTAWSLSVGGS